MVAHWFGSKQTTAVRRVSHLPRLSPSGSPATAAAPHGVATAPVHVLAQPATPVPARETSDPPTPGTQSAPATASPVPATAPAPTGVPVPALPPDAKPAIVSISISATDLHSGDVVSGTVITSSNVASVEARIKTYSANLNRLDVGRFGLSMRVPAIPLFLHGTYQLQVIARNAAGAIVTQDFPISIH